MIILKRTHIKLTFSLYSLCEKMTEMISIGKIKKNLQTKRVGRRIYCYKVVSSTNNVAKKLAEENASEGTVVVAEEQTSGRGRLDRKWFSPKGGLWFSIILKPEVKTFDASKIVFAVSLAVANTLRKNFNLKAEVKWPNDVLVNGKKICGILTESVTSDKSLKYVVVGVGLNSNISVKEIPRNLRESTTTLKEELEREVDLESLLCSLLFQIEQEYTTFLNKGFADILKRWKCIASFLGKRVEVVEAGKKYDGVAQDVDEEGLLVVRLTEGTVKKFTVGDIKVRF